MTRYIVLQDAASTKMSHVPAQGAKIGASLDRDRMMKLEAFDLEARDVAELLRDPRTRAIAETMPIRLIEPVASQGAATAPAAWGVEAVGADLTPLTGADVSVAVLDSGIDRTHPAFAGVDLVERDFTGSGNGDEDGHGTHCAGAIFGRDQGDLRIGVARGVRRALIGKVLDLKGGESEWVFKALDWALEERADIVSMSLGLDFPSDVARKIKAGWPAKLATSEALETYRNNLRVFDAIMKKYQAYAPFGREPLVMAASGNESSRETSAYHRVSASMPAVADGVISVGAVARLNQGLYAVADFSNARPTISAPGVGIISARSGGGLQAMDGTSMACPYAAGVAALWWEAVRRSGVSPNAQNVAARLIATARRDVFADKFDEIDLGQGLVTSPP